MRRGGLGLGLGFVVLRRAFDFEEVGFEEEEVGFESKEVGFEEEEAGLCFFVGAEDREGSFRFLEGCICVGVGFDIVLVYCRVGWVSRS